MSRVDRHGRDVHDVTGPFEIRKATPPSPDFGGTLDRAIVARLEDGRRVCIGELWAAGPAEGGARISLDAQKTAEKIVELLNGGAADRSGEAVAWIVEYEWADGKWRRAIIHTPNHLFSTDRNAALGVAAAYRRDGYAVRTVPLMRGEASASELEPAGAGGTEGR